MNTCFLHPFLGAGLALGGAATSIGVADSPTPAPAEPRVHERSLPADLVESWHVLYRDEIEAFLRNPQDPAIPDKTEAERNLQIDLTRRVVEEMLNRLPHGNMTQRELHFSAMAIMWLSAIGWMVNPVPLEQIAFHGGTGLGGAIGTLLEPGGGTALGVGIGAAGGAAAAIGISASRPAAVAAAVIATLPYAEWIHSKYPPDNPNGTTSGAASGTVAGAKMAYVASASSKSRRSGKSSSAYAGPFESLFIHLVGSTFAKQIEDFHKKWTSYPGLTREQRDFMRQHDWLRSVFARVSYIRDNRKLAPGARSAAPLPSWAVQIRDTLEADSAAARDAWLGALGLGAMTARVKSGKLRITTPAALRAVGASAELSATVPSVNSRTVKGPGPSGAQPYVKATFSWRDFSVNWGQATLVTSGNDRNKIKVNFSVNKSTKIANASFRYFVPGLMTKSASLTAVQLALPNKVSGDLYFVANGMNLAFDKVVVGSFSLSVPSINMGGINQAVQNALQPLLSSLKSQIASAFGSVKLDWGAVFAGLSTQPCAALEAALKTEASRYGFTTIDDLTAFAIRSGKMLATVLGRRVQIPALPGMPYDSAQMEKILRDAIASARRAVAATTPAQKRAPRRVSTVATTRLQARYVFTLTNGKRVSVYSYKKTRDPRRGDSYQVTLTTRATATYKVSEVRGITRASSTGAGR